MKLKLTFPEEFKGGPGSGHHGHSGRPGKRGGSTAGSGGGNAVAHMKRSAPNTYHAVSEMASLNDAGSINTHAELTTSQIQQFEKYDALFSDMRSRQGEEIPKTYFPNYTNDDYNEFVVGDMLEVFVAGEATAQEGIAKWYDDKDMPGTEAWDFMADVFDGNLAHILE